MTFIETVTFSRFDIEARVWGIREMTFEPILAVNILTKFQRAKYESLIVPSSFGELSSCSAVILESRMYNLIIKCFIIKRLHFKINNKCKRFIHLCNMHKE